MADRTAEEIVAVRASHYTGDPRIPLLLEMAEEFITKQLSGNKREWAKALWILHLMTLSDKTGNGADSNAGAGAIKKKKEEQLMIEYQSNYSSPMQMIGSLKEDLSRTSWGLELLAFFKMWLITAYTRYS